MTRAARCSCGQLSVIVHGDPGRVSVCHCWACQRRTGSTYGAQATFLDSQVAEIRGQSTEYVRTGDGGMKIRFHFCPACGATVYYRIPIAAGKIVIPVGAFADRDFPAPSVSVYEERMHPWVSVPDEAEHIP